MVGVCMTGGMHGRMDMHVMEHVWQGPCMAGGCAWRGACMAGGLWQRGHMWHGTCMTGEAATAADGTHPTGMHSCCSVKFIC